MQGSKVARPLSELAAHVGGIVLGEPSLTITGVNGLAEARPGDLSFYGSPKYKKQVEQTRAAAVLIAGAPPKANGLTFVQVPNPHLAFAKISALFFPRPVFAPGVSPQAHVHPEAVIDPSATVMAGACVEARARIGPGTALYPGAYVGADAIVGPHCVLHPHASVLEGCRLGARVVLHAGCVIGADGFGFAFDPSGPEHVKVPQAGIVRIEDDVEIGACSCIDRATLGETVVGRGTKIDNLVQIAHNVKIGPLSLLCAQVGVSGSAEIGSGVVLAGQVGVVGHIRVGDLAKVGAQSGVGHDVADGAVLSGSPAIPHLSWLRAVAAFPQLAELVREVRALRRKVEALDKENPS